MRDIRRGRLALWGGTLILTLTPGLSRAQDGQQPVGPPVTEPRTNANKVNPAQPISDAPPAGTTRTLPGVPATADDPAPPGTRGVRVDPVIGPDGAVGPTTTPAIPGARTATGVLPAAPAGAPGAMTGRAPNSKRAMPGISQVEGVVTKLMKPGDDLAEERIRFTLDPAQDWTSYVQYGPEGLPNRGDGVDGGKKIDDQVQPAQADRAEAEAAGDQAPDPIEMVLTRRTHVFTHGRTAEGYDVFGVNTLSSPGVETSRSGATLRPVDAAAAPTPASFTNIKEGSFLAVRYRKRGDVHEVLNVSLIEMPTIETNPPTATEVGSATAPGSIPSTTTIPGAIQAGTPTPSPAAIPGARVPAVPATPSGPAVPR